MFTLARVVFLVIPKKNVNAVNYKYRIIKKNYLDQSWTGLIFI